MRSSLQIVGRWWKFLLAGIGLAVVFGAPRLARHLMETRALTSGPNGSETPASLGVPFERVAIPSGVRRLDSYVVTADGACENPPVIVNYHGVQETISEWVKGGKRLCFGALRRRDEGCVLSGSRLHHTRLVGQREISARDSRTPVGRSQ